MFATAPAFHNQPFTINVSFPDSNRIVVEVYPQDKVLDVSNRAAADYMAETRKENVIVTQLKNDKDFSFPSSKPAAIIFRSDQVVYADLKINGVLLSAKEDHVKIQAYFNTRTVLYQPDPEAMENQELKRYVSRATYCKQEAETQAVVNEFEQLVGRVYEQKKQYSKEIPFIFVCSSSGMGKTQLPFTLSSPVIYFTYRPTDSQGIYVTFKKLSQVLVDTFRQDQFNYQSFWEGSDFSLFQMSTRTEFKSWTAGFLVKLLTKVYQIKSENPHMTWIQAELACPQFDYEPMQIGESKKLIKQIRNDTLLTIFLDEVVRITDIEFRFKRSLIRVLGLALVIMGTNAKAANFVDQRNVQDSRNDKLLPWCFVFHKLPPISPKYLENTYFKQVIADVNDWQSSYKPKVSLLVNSLFRILKLERPLFAISAAESIKKFVDQVIAENKKCDSKEACQFITNLAESIFKEFVHNKQLRNDKNFSVGQLDFVDPRARKQLSSMCIHKHLGFISEADDDIEKSTSYFPLYLNDSTLHWKKTSQNPYAAPSFTKFYAYSVMPTFDQMPLTSLGFTGPTMTAIDEFAMKEHRSAIKLNLLFETERKGQRRNDYEQIDGKFLERATDMGIMLASHSCGLVSGERVYFRHIFPHFVRELQADYGETTPVVDFTNPNWQNIDTVPIPYCATSGATWNSEMHKLLTGLGCNLGYLNRKPNYPLDVVVFDTDTEREILGLELKSLFDNDNGHKSQDDDNKTKMNVNKTKMNVNKTKKYKVDASILRSKLNSIRDNIPNEKRAKIVIIVATHFTEFHSFDNQQEEHKGKTKRPKREVPTLKKIFDDDQIWLVKLETNENNYRFQMLYTPPVVSRVCILVDLKNMHSINGKPSEVYQEFMKICKTPKS